MTVHPAAHVLSLPEIGTPQLDGTAFVAAGAVIVGRVSLGAQSSVWYNCVLRAEWDDITLGERSNLQDGTLCHVDAGFPLTIGSGVSVGHGAILHGCTVEDDVLIGMGARVLNGAVVGKGSLVAAGAVVLEGTVIPPGSLVAGVPGKVRRPLTDEEQQRIQLNAAVYLRHTAEHEQL